MAYTGGKSYLSTALASLPDIAVDYMFAVEFNLNGSKLTFASEFQDLTVKARTCVIPGRSTEVIESWFMGSKQVFPAKTTYTNEVSIKFEEFQDGGTHGLLKKWQDAIYVIIGSTTEVVHGIQRIQGQAHLCDHTAGIFPAHPFCSGRKYRR